MLKEPFDLQNYGFWSSKAESKLFEIAKNKDVEMLDLVLGMANISIPYECIEEYFEKADMSNKFNFLIDFQKFVNEKAL